MAARLVVAFSVALGACSADPPRCVLPGDYRLSFVLDGRTDAIAIHIPDPMERFRPDPRASDERNAEVAAHWATMLRGELVAPVPSLGLEPVDGPLEAMFVRPDVPRCALAISVFPQSPEMYGMFELALIVDKTTGAVTGQLTGDALKASIAITGQRTPLPASARR
jgi:hypothetical protein